MRVDGRDIVVTGGLLQPLTRRTSDILRLAGAMLFLGIVIAGSLITRREWVALERSVSQIVDFLPPTQSRLLYLVYGIALLALPFAILITLVSARRWKLLSASAVAALLTVLSLSMHRHGISTPHWHFHRADLPVRVLAQFLNDPRWIAMLAAVLTVCGPWLPDRWQRRSWALLLAFVPMHLVVNAVVPARSLLGLAVGWLVGALVILVVGTPGLEVPLAGAVRVMTRRGYAVSELTVIRPAGPGPLVLSAASTQPDPAPAPVIELYGPHQRIGGALNQIWHKLRLRHTEAPPLHASMHRALEHRALMAVAIGDLGMSNTAPITVAALDRGWTLYAHQPARGVPLVESAATTPVIQVWKSLRRMHDQQISHGDLRNAYITVEDGTVLFGAFTNAEYGAGRAQLHSDISQLLVTTSALYGAESAVSAAIEVFGRGAVLSASRRLTKTGVPARVRGSVTDAGEVIVAIRQEVLHQTGADQIESKTVTRFTRSQIIELVLLAALVYVAYPFLSAVPTFFSQVRTADPRWALVALAVTALTYLSAATALWAAADGLVSWKRLTIMQVGNTFAATTTPAGVGGLALSTQFLQRSGLSPMRATAAVTLQQAVQVIVHITLLIGFIAAADASAQLSEFVPDAQVLFLVAGVALGIVGAVVLVPRLRSRLTTTVHPKLKEVTAELVQVLRRPKRLALILLGDAGTTLGAALALWACVGAFGGSTTLVTIALVTMVGETLASAAPTPGGVGA
ncbi:MAG: lysylphosphatidylglycerol synthase transmembrane domain-containing protein, partial [Mycobacterium sp.]